jgi:hypothetical protein
VSHPLSGIYACSAPFGMSHCRVSSWHVSLVMGGQSLRIFSTGTSWFHDFLVISGLCAPWVSTSGDIGEGGFLLPGRVFLHKHPFEYYKYCSFLIQRTVLITGSIVQGKSSLISWRFSCRVCSYKLDRSKDPTRLRQRPNPHLGKW